MGARDQLPRPVVNRDITGRQQAEEAQRELAVLEERNRLARELHDSVTQSLYSLTLFAEAGLRLAASGKWERVISYLGELGESSQQALKESISHCPSDSKGVK